MAILEDACHKTPGTCRENSLPGQSSRNRSGFESISTKVDDDDELPLTF